MYVTIENDQEIESLCKQIVVVGKRLNAIHFLKLIVKTERVFLCL